VALNCEQILTFSLKPSYYFVSKWQRDQLAMRVGENDENYLQNELSSFGIDCKRRNEFNDKDELEALATAIKEVYFQDYKTAYDHISRDHDYSEAINKKSQFMIWGRELVK
jgi:hypothetical protein